MSLAPAFTRPTNHETDQHAILEPIVSARANAPNIRRGEGFTLSFWIADGL
jgi:hypothetical protein